MMPPAVDVTFPDNWELVRQPSHCRSSVGSGSKEVMMARILDLDELPHEPQSHEFVGADHGDVPFSIILVHSQPDVGPRLHRHPYAEVFLVESGEATFQIGETRLVVPAGQVVVSPRGEAHGFVNGGTGELRLIAIHAAGRFNTEWLDGPDPVWSTKP
jgi:mannose-6-phosphate isomerase-like protein (cupin superfamily)